MDGTVQKQNHQVDLVINENLQINLKARLRYTSLVYRDCLSAAVSSLVVTLHAVMTANSIVNNAHLNTFLNSPALNGKPRATNWPARAAKF